MRIESAVGHSTSPGDVLRIELESRDWTATEFAQILDRPVQVVSEILNSKKAITTETALEFAAALGTSAELWLNLQSAHHLTEARNNHALSDVERRARLRKVVPVAEMRRRTWLSDSSDVDVLEAEVTALFGGSLQPEQFPIAAKRANHGDPLSPAQTAWLMFVRAAAAKRAVNTAPFDAQRLADFAASLCGWLVDGPERLADLRDALAECGVVLVVEAGLAGGKFDGVAFITENGSPAIAMTGRYNRFDIFVFALLHEIAHHVLGHVKPGSTFVLDDLDDTASDPNEMAANELAEKWIFVDGFRPPATRSASSIARYAALIGVPTSMVIGRLHREELLRPTQFRQHLKKVRPYLEPETQWPK